MDPVTATADKVPFCEPPKSILAKSATPKWTICALRGLRIQYVDTHVHLVHTGIWWSFRSLS